MRKNLGMTLLRMLIGRRFLYEGAFKLVQPWLALKIGSTGTVRFVYSLRVNTEGKKYS